MIAPLSSPLRRRAVRRGFTLIESLITVAVIAIVAAIAVPSMYGFIARKRVQGVADQLMMDLRYAKSLQASRSTDIVIKFRQDAAQTCYVIYDYSAVSSCDCLSSTVCPSAAVTAYRTVSLPASQGVKIETLDSTVDRIRLFGDQGTPIHPATSSSTPAALQFNLKVSSPAGGQIKVYTNDTFLPRACSISGHHSAYAACPAPPPS